MLLENKNALITGSNGGIGTSILETFAKEGCSTIWAHSRLEYDSHLSEIQKLSRKYGTEIIPIHFDLMDTPKLQQELRSILLSKKKVDILVNNAGIAHGALFSMTPIPTIKQIFAVNLFAGMEITQSVIRRMVHQKSGSIINMASISGLDLNAGNSAYGVSKAALIAWTKTVAAELGGTGVRINAVAPGLTDTRMATYMESKARVEMIRRSAENRLTTPQESANVVLFLATDLSSHVNGQIIRVDGGQK